MFDKQMFFRAAVYRGPTKSRLIIATLPNRTSLLRPDINDCNIARGVLVDNPLSIWRPVEIHFARRQFSDAFERSPKFYLLVEIAVPDKNVVRVCRRRSLECPCDGGRAYASRPPRSRIAYHISSRRRAEHIICAAAVGERECHLWVSGNGARPGFNRNESA